MPRKYTAEEREARARPGYHDPTVSPDIPPARSALTMRLFLAGFGLAVCGLLSTAFVMAHQTVLAAIFAFLAAVALMDIIVVARRKLRGEPGLAATAVRSPLLAAAKRAPIAAIPARRRSIKWQPLCCLPLIRATRRISSISLSAVILRRYFAAEFRSCVVLHAAVMSATSVREAALR